MTNAKFVTFCLFIFVLAGCPAHRNLVFSKWPDRTEYKECTQTGNESIDCEEINDYKTEAGYGAHTLRHVDFVSSIPRVVLPHGYQHVERMGSGVVVGVPGYEAPQLPSASAPPTRKEMEAVMAWLTDLDKNVDGEVDSKKAESENSTTEGSAP